MFLIEGVSTLWLSLWRGREEETSRIYGVIQMRWTLMRYYIFVMKCWCRSLNNFFKFWSSRSLSLLNTCWFSIRQLQRLLWLTWLMSCACPVFWLLQLLREINGTGRSVRLRRQAEAKTYISSHFQNLPVEFKLGDGSVYGAFMNRPLVNGQEYVCFVLAILELGQNVSPSFLSHF